MRPLRLRPDFPLGPPSWPTGLPREPDPPDTGVAYDTTWSRRLPARLARSLIVDDVLRPAVHLLGWPRVEGLERLDVVPAPVIFAPNHSSHLDTPLVLTSLPDRFRHKTVVAAAADYFFPTRTRGALSAVCIGAIPMERTKINRASSDLSARLLDRGWNLILFPEGGRSPDGWGQDFRGGVAYLSLRCGRPVVPVQVAGSRRVLRRGKRFPSPIGEHIGRGPGLRVRFGAPMWPEPGETSRRFGTRIESAVAALADEAATDWWSARRRAAQGATPALKGPEAAAWRRAWALDEAPGRRDIGTGWP